MTVPIRLSPPMALCSALGIVVLFAGSVRAQKAPDPNSPAPAPQSQSPAGRGQMGMMAERGKMMAEMAAAEKKLDGLVAAMNGATGAGKIDRVAAVVTELVAQHKAMHSRMMSMQGGMMGAMMQRGQPATPPTDATPPADHEPHHPPTK